MEGIVFRSSDNQALTTSAIVAEKFGKEHKHVLEAIRKILKTSAEKSLDVGNQQLAKMFALSEVEQPMPVGGGVKKLPIYVMNRDGFTLLAMGFTGAKALVFKLEYMNAFNAMEQQIRQSSGVPQSFAQALMLAAKQQEMIEAQQKQLEVQQPKVEFADALTTGDGCILISEMAKLLTRNGFVTGRTRLYRWMREHGYIFKRSTEPIQMWVERGIFAQSVTVIKTNHGTEERVTTKVTGKGQEYFLRLLCNQ